MNLKAFALLASFAITAPSCTVYVREVGTPASDGSVYLGTQLFSGNPKSDQEEYVVGQQHGAFSSIRLHADDAIALRKVLVVFADGERAEITAPERLSRDQWTNPIALPRGPRAIYSVQVTASNPGKRLASLEIHGVR